MFATKDRSILWLPTYSGRSTFFDRQIDVALGEPGSMFPYRDLKPRQFFEQGLLLPLRLQPVNRATTHWQAEGKEVTLDELLHHGKRHIVLIAEGGAGKSTLLLHLLFEAEQGRLRGRAENGEMSDEVHLAPVLARLRNYKGNTAAGVFFKDCELPSSGVSRTDVGLRRALETYPDLLLLLDGLNEVKAEERGRFAESCRKWFDAAKRHFIIATSRREDLLRPDTLLGSDLFRDFAVYEVQPLTEQQVFAGLASVLSQKRAEAVRQQLDRAYPDLLRNPLLLTLARFAAQRQPDAVSLGRASLYRSALEEWFNRWLNAPDLDLLSAFLRRKKMDESRDEFMRTALRLIGTLALGMIERDGAVNLTEGEALRLLHEHPLSPCHSVGSDDISRILKDVLSTGLLPNYGVLHESLRDYFAGETLADNWMEFNQRATEYIETQSADSATYRPLREATKFMVDILPITPTRGYAANVHNARSLADWCHQQLNHLTTQPPVNLFALDHLPALLYRLGDYDRLFRLFEGDFVSQKRLRFVAFDPTAADNDYDVLFDACRDAEAYANAVKFGHQRAQRRTALSRAVRTEGVPTVMGHLSAHDESWLHECMEGITLLTSLEERVRTLSQLCDGLERSASDKPLPALVIVQMDAVLQEALRGINDGTKADAVRLRLRGCRHAPPQQAERVLTEALAAARAIQDEGSRSRALAAVAGACGSLNEAQAERVLTEALAAARAIQDEGSRSDALAAVAGACGSLNEAQAERVLTEALAAARAIQAEGYRSDALAAVAGAWRASSSVAERAMRMIPREAEIQTACASLSDALPDLPPPDRARLLLMPARFGSRGDADQLLTIAARWAGALGKIGKDEAEVVGILEFVEGELKRET